MRKSERAKRFISREGDFTLIRRRGQKFIKGLKRQRSAVESCDPRLILRGGHVKLQKNGRKKRIILLCGTIGAVSMIGSVLFIKKAFESIRAMISE